MLGFKLWHIFLHFRVWSKVIIVSAPELGDTGTQEAVEDMAARMRTHGDKCVIYNLSFAQVWNDWDENKSKYLR